MNGRIVLLAVVIAASLFVLKSVMAGGGGKRASTLNRYPEGKKLETATFGGGCFWHVEDSFRQVEGVIATEVGFESGTQPEPTYRDVCTDATGHAEVVRVQYRSVNFYHSPEQKSQAEGFKSALEKSGRYKRPIVTQITAATKFWKAEEYHQQYYEKQRS